MSTSTPASASDSIGILGDPALADQLARSGLTVVSDPDVAQAARLVTQSPPQVTLVIDGPGLPEGMGPWLHVNAAVTRTIVVDHPDGRLADVREAPDGARIAHIARDRDTCLAEVLAQAGLQAEEAIKAVRVVLPRLSPPPSAPPAPTPAPAHEPSQAELGEQTRQPTPAPAHESLPSAPVPAAAASGSPVYLPPASTPLPAAGPAPSGRRHETAVGDMMAAATAATRRPKAKLLFVLSGKGGVLKTTMAITLAQRAARAGAHVLLVDANRGQGDTRACLRMDTAAGLPSIYDYAEGTLLSECILSPQAVNAARGGDRDPVAFYFLPAPPAGMTAPYIVTADVYRRAIIAGRAGRNIDLVIVDTQVSNDTDESGLFDQVYLPMLHDDAWAVALTDTSTQSVVNLGYRMDSFTLDPARTFIVTTLLTDEETALTDRIRDYTRTWGSFAGAVPHDPTARARQRDGNLLDEHPAFRQATGTVLTRLLGRDFDASPPAAGRAGWRRLLSRRRP